MLATVRDARASMPPNNTLNTQSRAQQTHSRSRSLRAHPHSADPPSVIPRAARLGRRSWVNVSYNALLWCPKAP
eukprot:scaffold977_cov38-Phaeocystis_antarctica.AAC.5